MAVEYSYPLVQTVDVDENVLFLNGNRCCRKGLIMHNDNSGVFRVKGVSIAVRQFIRCISMQTLLLRQVAQLNLSALLLYRMVKF
jgi:hypothetical protein